MSDTEFEQTDDTSDFLESLRTDMLTQNDKIENLSREVSDGRQYKDVVEKMRQALAGDGRNPADAEATVRRMAKQPGWIDDFLDQSLELDKQGRPVPMTTKLGVELAQAQADAELMKEEIALLREAQKRADRENSPASQANKQMFAAMDDLLVGTIEGLYGEFDAGVYEAGVKKLGDVLNYIKAEEPEKWEVVRRNKGHQQHLVQSVMKSVIPPAAWQALQEKEMEAEEITERHFYDAYKELDALDVPVELKHEIADTLRVQLKELKYNGVRRYNKR